MEQIKIMNARLSLSSLRMSTITGVVLCVIVTGYSILRFPAILDPLRVGMMYLLILAIVLMSYIILVLALTRNSDATSLWVAYRGFNWGLAIAGFWLLEIVAGNLFDPKHSLVKLVYFGSSIFAFGFPLFAGIGAAGRTGLIHYGTRVGLWSGIVSGLLTFLCLMGVTYLFLSVVLQDPQNVLQFKTSNAADLT